MKVITVDMAKGIDFQNELMTYKKSLLFPSRYRFKDLLKISILTNDQGPFVEDTAYAFFFTNDVIIIPCGHLQYNETYEYITKHFKVDFETIIQAMCSTSNQEFVIWKKEYGIVN